MRAVLIIKPYAMLYLFIILVYLDELILIIMRCAFLFNLLIDLKKKVKTQALANPLTYFNIVVKCCKCTHHFYIRIEC